LKKELTEEERERLSAFAETLNQEAPDEEATVEN
jgi:hypothetical protein